MKGCCGNFYSFIIMTRISVIILVLNLNKIDLAIAQDGYGFAPQSPVQYYPVYPSYPVYPVYSGQTSYPVYAPYPPSPVYPQYGSTPYVYYLDPNPVIQNFGNSPVAICPVEEESIAVRAQQATVQMLPKESVESGDSTETTYLSVFNKKYPPQTDESLEELFEKYRQFSIDHYSYSSIAQGPRLTDEISSAKKGTSCIGLSRNFKELAASRGFELQMISIMAKDSSHYNIVLKPDLKLFNGQTPPRSFGKHILLFDSRSNKYFDPTFAQVMVHPWDSLEEVREIDIDKSRKLMKKNRQAEELILKERNFLQSKKKYSQDVSEDTIEVSPYNR